MLHNPEVESENGWPTVNAMVFNYKGSHFLVETLDYPKERASVCSPP